MKQIVLQSKAKQATVGPITVSRALPNRYTQQVGPIAFLDHILENEIPPKSNLLSGRSFAHPHKGIATFTYLVKGELRHFDSSGNQGVVGDGGIQWMKAGNGIIHDEHLSDSFRETGGKMQGFQFWINLPAKNKAESPEYMPVQSEELPIVDLPEKKGTLKVLLGEFDGKKSKIPVYSKQFIYHLKLEKGANYVFKTKDDLEYAAYIPNDLLKINGLEFEGQELVVFSNEESDIQMINTSDKIIDVLLFGGEPYLEEVFAEGPFIMNSELEIAKAYKEYKLGEYGTIDYTIKD